MAIYLLDSGILIDVLNGKRGRAEMVTQLIREGSELACCSINVTEVYAGVRPGEEEKTERLLRSLRFYEVTWETARLAGNLQSSWRQQGRTLALPDATIAAVAAAHKLVLVTNNIRDFPMPELTVYPAP
ncbi:MAG: PIN domain-containing protein [Bryobacteraceae bacterium]|jgi:predicted nucleic acid-binding protein